MSANSKICICLVPKWRLQLQTYGLGNRCSMLLSYKGVLTTMRCYTKSPLRTFSISGIAVALIPLKVLLATRTNEYPLQSIPLKRFSSRFGLRLIWVFCKLLSRWLPPSPRFVVIFYKHSNKKSIFQIKINQTYKRSATHADLSVADLN